ncbi:hypothetical protein AB6A40_007102 [Gnathostoma spinigerum]|uniref:Regulatory protein zeste n=1 Tax=Gnathostoma spinigerum TaxID=75299 RepID=A0ABD6EK85_9BILA
MGESSCGLLNQKKSERGRYICQLSDSLSATLQSSSRLYQSNVERAGAWDQITSMVNERYGEELGSLTTEQTRRIYTSLKRKLTKNRGKVTKTNSTEAKLQHDRVKVNGIVPDEWVLFFSDSNIREMIKHSRVQVKSEADGSACSGTLSRLTSMSPNRSGEIFAESLMECATKPKPREVIHLSKHSTDKKHGASSRCLPVNNLSTIELLALLAQRDAEIRQLKNRLMQKSVEHQLRVSRLIEKMAEVVKIAVNDSVQREIMGALDQDVFICGDITNDETFDDNEV